MFHSITFNHRFNLRLVCLLINLIQDVADYLSEHDRKKVSFIKRGSQLIEKTNDQLRIKGHPRRSNGGSCQLGPNSNLQPFNQNANH